MTDLLQPVEQRARKMPATTLYQPYASLIAIGAKPFESRDWPAPAAYIGKCIAIHAGVNRDDMRAIFDPRQRSPVETPIRAALAAHDLHPVDLPLGVVLCTATLAGAYQVRTLNAAAGNAAIGKWIAGSRSLDGFALLSSGQRAVPVDPFGYYESGRWLWWLTDIERIDPPIPARGFQRFWGWEPPQ